MEFRYNGEYSVFIKPLYYAAFPVPDEGFNTWDDLNLIPTSKLVISPSAFNASIIQPSYSNAIIDLTDRNIGIYKYGQSSGDWEFIIDSSRYTSNRTISIIESCIHGYYSKVRMTNDETIYIGRVYISNIDQEDEYTKITLSYVLKPCDNIKYDENYGEISTNNDSSGGESGQIPSQDTTNMILLSDPMNVSSGWKLARSGHGLPTQLYEEYSAYASGGKKTYRTYIIPGSSVRLKSISNVNTVVQYMITKYSFKKDDDYKLYLKYGDSRHGLISGFTLANKKIDPNKNGGGYRFYINRYDILSEKSPNNQYIDLAIGIRTENEPDINYEISYFIYILTSVTGIVE